MVPSILTFDINPILGSFLGFGAKLDYFWAWDKVRMIFRGLLIHTNNFCFLNIALFLLYLQFIFFSRDGRTDKGTYRSSRWSLKTQGWDPSCMVAKDSFNHIWFLILTSFFGLVWLRLTFLFLIHANLVLNRYYQTSFTATWIFNSLSLYIERFFPWQALDFFDFDYYF